MKCLMFRSSIAIAACLMVLGLVVNPASAQFTIAEYDADAGSPVDAASIQGPTDQGFFEWASTKQGQTLDMNDIQEGVIDSGVNAWRNRDGDGNNNPGYGVDLGPNMLNNMFNDGWVMEATIKMVEGGHFMAWGFGEVNPWGTGTRERAGVSLSLFTPDGEIDELLRLSPVDGAAVDVGLSSDFFKIKMTGDAGATTYKFEVFDLADNLIDSQDLDITTSGSNSLGDDVFALQSGSSGGDNREMLINHFSLTTVVPEPSSLLLCGLGLMGFVASRRR